jgi:mannose-6-phosphate isomerase-like protein (cupin superfamily)
MTTQVLSKLIRKTFEAPDEVRRFPKGRIELLTLEDTSLARIFLQPGWKWSNDIKPTVQTDSCMIPHVQYVISGRLMVSMDDGEKFEMKPGDTVSIPPGHDAWVVGDETFVAIDLTGLKEYAARFGPSRK